MWDLPFHLSYCEVCQVSYVEIKPEEGRHGAKDQGG